MKPSELYKLWAPEDSIWSNWAKPVLFADTMFIDHEPPPSTQWQSSNIAWATGLNNETAIVLDLPDAVSIWVGIALTQRGFRPVPLYNGVAGPFPMGPSPLVDTFRIVQALHGVIEMLVGLRLPPDAPPVFLLDSNRFNGGAFATPGRFDNRWWIFPQDFPSANFLLSRKIQSVVLVQTQPGRLQKDLAHVLLLWQQAGLHILSAGMNDQVSPQPLQVERPDSFRALWYRALVLAGLRRNSAGGFGAIIPEPSSGGGYG